jgi:hypothetical protein
MPDIQVEPVHVEDTKPFGLSTSPHESIAPTQCFLSDSGEKGLLAMNQLDCDLDLSSMDYFMMQSPSVALSDPNFGSTTSSTLNTCESGIPLTPGTLQSSTSNYMTPAMQADL